MEIAKRTAWETLNSVTLPESLRSIGDSAFEGTDLENVSIPEGVTEIGKDAFPEPD